MKDDPGGADSKIEAIRRYRMLTGASLKDAKAAVEAARGADAATFTGGQRPRSAMPEESVRAEMLVDLTANRKIAAIRRYRRATGASLTDAKTAVEELAVQYGISPPVVTRGTTVRSGVITFAASTAILALIVLFLYRFATP